VRAYVSVCVRMLPHHPVHMYICHILVYTCTCILVMYPVYIHVYTYADCTECRALLAEYWASFILCRALFATYQDFLIESGALSAEYRAVLRDVLSDIKCVVHV